MGAPVPPQVIGRYALFGKIASGGMARVCLGTSFGAAGFSRTVAIKQLHPHLAEDPDFVSAMIDEARLAARIHHPNVVPTLDVVAAEGELLLVMEYVRGESFARLLRAESDRKGRVSIEVASAVVIGALQGLHAAHVATSDRGAPLEIVHRDVSPHNILVGVDGVARVIDFGVAKAAGRLQTTRDGAVKGKVAYMAPEQLSGSEATRAADIYAMGVVLWEALTGRRMFQGDNDAALFGQVLAGADTPPSAHAPGLPAALDALVMKALARAPLDRFASAKEMAETLLGVCPPAFPTVVGKWVEEMASKALADRAAVLAEIESQSDMTLMPASVDARVVLGRGTRRALSRASPATVTGDDTQMASQPSSVSVETPKPKAGIARRRARRTRARALGAAALLAVGATFLWWRAATTGGPAPSAAVPGIASQANVGPTPTTSVPTQSASTRPADVAPDSVAGAAPGSHTPTTSTGARAPVPPASKPRVVAPKTVAPFRFTHPD